MSAHIHGNPKTRQRDRAIREELRNRDFEVFEIPFGDLSDREAMRQHFYRPGRRLISRDQATQLRDDPQWFDEPPVHVTPPTRWAEILDLLDPNRPKGFVRADWWNVASVVRWTQLMVLLGT